MKHPFLLALFFVFLGSQIKAQTPDLRFNRLGVPEGIPGHAVYDIAKDHQGFMWFATDNGLARYDGYDFQIYRPIQGDSTSLGSAFVTAIMEDAEGHLWIGTAEAGLHRFEAETQSFLRFPVSPDSSNGTSHVFINDIFQASDGTIWIGTDGGLDAFSAGTFTHYKYDESGQGALRSPIVTDILEGKDRTLWIATHAGLYALDPGTNTLHLHPVTDSDRQEDRQLNTLHLDQSGQLWIGSNGGLVKMEPSTGTAQRFAHVQGDSETLSSNRVYAIVQDADGVLWIGTLGNDISDGLNRFDPSTGSFKRYRMDPDDPFALSSNRVVSLFADNNHLLWVGTQTHGLNRVDLQGERIVRYHSDQPAGIPSNEIFTIRAAESGDLWIGGWTNGLGRLNPQTGSVETISPANSALSGENILDVLEEKNGNLWVGTFDGLNYINTTTGRIVTYRHDPEDPSSIVSDAATSIERDRDGNLWIGSWREGLSMLPTGGSQFVRFTHDPDDDTSLPDNQIMKIREDKRGILWLQSWDALYSYDHRSGRFQKLPVEHVNDFTFDDAGRLWVGTSDRGIVYHSIINNEQRVYGTDEGLPHESVTGLVADMQGDIWAATARGIARLDHERGRFHNYISTPLIRSNKLGMNRASRSMDGSLYFSSGNGLYRLHPDDFIDSQQQIPTRLTEIKVNGTGSLEAPILPVYITPDNPISLRHSQNDLSFYYAGLGYRASNEYRYRYRLHGYKDTWEETGSSREARYTNLSPGTYRFEVQTANEDGLWTDNAGFLSINIRPPWWRTPIAYVFFFLGSVATMVGIIKYRESALRQRAQELERQVRLRTHEISEQKNAIEVSRKVIEEQAERLVEHDKMKSRFFTNISHEFRTPLTLILGPLRDAQRGLFGQISHKLLRQVHLMERNGRRLQGLINQLLELAKFDSAAISLKAERVDAAGLTRRIVRSFSSLAERKNIRLSLRIEWLEREEEFYPQLYVEIDKYEQILNNLLSNALKFTPESGNVDVRLDLIDESFKIDVCDSGAGIPESELSLVFNRFRQVHPREHHHEGSSGIGLALAKEWVTLHQGTISVENRKEGGACFTVLLPTGSSHLTPEQIVATTDQMLHDRSEVHVRDDFTIFTDSLEDTATSPATTSRKVLLVEDNEDLRAYIRDHLSARYKVVEATNGIEALRLATDEKPDLVISDVMMPEMDGYTLCRKLKATPNLEDLPIILLTARADEEAKVEGLRTGADDYMFKPFSATELLVRAENLIDIRAHLRKTYSNQVFEVTPSDITVESVERAFLQQIQDLVEQYIDNPNFGTEWMADEIGLSPRQLRRRIKELTGLSTTGFLRTLRLQRAAQLLAQEAGTVSEIAYAVGFNDPKYFSRLFRQVYGMSPSEYAA